MPHKNAVKKCIAKFIAIEKFPSHSSGFPNMKKDILQTLYTLDLCTQQILQKSGLTKLSNMLWLSKFRWPLVIDNTERVSVFLRHRDCNYVDALDKEQMTSERIRLALLGGVRYVWCCRQTQTHTDTDTEIGGKFNNGN